MTNYTIICVACAKQAERIYGQHLPHIKRRAYWCQARALRFCDHCGGRIKPQDPCYAQTTWEKGDKQPDRWEDKHVEVLSTKEGPIEAREL